MFSVFARITSLTFFQYPRSTARSSFTRRASRLSPPTQARRQPTQGPFQKHDDPRQGRVEETGCVRQAEEVYGIRKVELQGLAATQSQIEHAISHVVSINRMGFDVAPGNLCYCDINVRCKQVMIDIFYFSAHSFPTTYLPCLTQIPTKCGLSTIVTRTCTTLVHSPLGLLTIEHSKKERKGCWS